MSGGPYRAYPEEAEAALNAWIASREEGVWTSPAGWWYAAWMHREAEIERYQEQRGEVLFENQRLQATRDEAIARLSVLVDAFEGDCRLDHHGFCQEHLVTKPCEIAEARLFLSRQ